MEVVLVDDGSDDGSRDLLVGWALRDPRVKLLELSRNFGHQAALTAGLDASRGDAVVFLDADLQDPPELIEAFLGEYRRGFDVVYGVRRSREGEGLLKRGTAWLFYRFAHRFLSQHLPRNTGDFRLMARPVVDALGQLREGGRFLRGMIAWLGFRQVAVPYDRPARRHGRTKFPWSRMIAFSIDAALSFSSRPLRLASHLGIATMLLGIVFSAWIVVHVVMHGRATPGWASLAVLQCFLSGTVLFAIGVMGEYLSRLYEEQKGRPLYVVRATYGDAAPAGPLPRGVWPASAGSPAPSAGESEPGEAPAPRDHPPG